MRSFFTGNRHKNGCDRYRAFIGGAAVQAVREEGVGRRQKVLRRGAKPTAACWISGKRIVLIRFRLPCPREDEFIEAFLQKFPSSL